MNRKIKQIDIHDMAILNSSQAALDICEMLPETDIVLELHKILAEQFNILVTVLEDKHYGSNNLHKFIQKCDKIIRQSTQKNKGKNGHR